MVSSSVIATSLPEAIFTAAAKLLAEEFSVILLLLPAAIVVIPEISSVPLFVTASPAVMS